MRAFVTVGSTHFDDLVSAVLKRDTLQALVRRGFTELVVQCGKSSLDVFPPGKSDFSYSSDGIAIHLWGYKPSLKEDVEMSDLIISHAGSGTLLEVLRRHKPLIAVANPSLLHNHQEELAQALHAKSFLQVATTTTLSSAIETIGMLQISKFPDHNGAKFQQLLDEEMGYS